MRKLLPLLLFIFPLFLTAQTKQVTLEDIYKKGIFRVDAVPGFNSMKDGRYYVETSTTGIIKKSFATGAVVDTLVRSRDVKDEAGKELGLYDIAWSEDEQQLLVFKERESIYRRSSKAIVYVYDVKTKKSSKLNDSKVLHATFSPDGTKVAFVKDNNLFYKILAQNKTIQVTKDGKWNSIINGNCDWVYEEEFSFTRAFQWSPKSNYIAYYKFDESKVPMYTMAVYDSLYPKQYTYKYPKAGEPNSTIQIHIYNTKSAADVKADIGKETDIYIPRIKWTTNDTKLSITWLNRLQNDMRLLSADAATGKTSVLNKETNKYYVDAEAGDVEFLEDGKHFLVSSEKDGFKHIYLHSLTGSETVQLTKGNYEVTDVIGVDEKNSKVYFMAAYQSPLNRDFCSVNFDGSNFKIISKKTGTNTVRMSSDFSYALLSFSTINSVPVYEIIDNNANVIRTLKTNEKLTTTAIDFGFTRAEFIKVPNTKGDSLNGWMLKPLNFDASKKYPVLFCNYGGPGSQQVANRWGAVSAWHQYFVQHGIIVVSVDNTGTGFRGEEFKKKTYLQLGKLEIEDQIDAAKYLSTLPYVDGKRIGHWGWSFGGFMSSLAITKGADVFKLAVAGAPVTSWRFYDNIYTERYMRTPQENKKGYDENAPLSFTSNIRGKFLIVHGTADDNVHFQNSVMMVDEMIKKNVDFESGYYPNKSHGIRGGNADFHVYSKMTKFIVANL